MIYKVRYFTNYSHGLGVGRFTNKEKLFEWLKFHIDELEYIVIEEVLSDEK